MKRIFLLTAAMGMGLMLGSQSVFAQATQPAAASVADPNEPPPSVPLPEGMTPIFDGKTLEGWAQAPKNASTFGGGDFVNFDSFAKKLNDKSDPVSAYIADQLDDAGKAAIASPTTMPAKQQHGDLAKSLNKLVAGPSIYDTTRFANVKLSDEASELLKNNPQGADLMRLNRVLLENAFPDELGKSPAFSWEVKNGSLASVGAGRGVLYTTKEFGNYRIIFDMKHVSGKPDHQACVLVFCTTPPPGEKGMDALGGIQFQVPNGGHWDYRPGKNNGGNSYFTSVTKSKFDVHQWSRVEILVDSTNGTARMAVAQPVGSKAVEVVDFKDEATAGKKGPFALQMHNKGLFDQYANIAVQMDPKEMDLITTK